MTTYIAIVESLHGNGKVASSKTIEAESEFDLAAEIEKVTDNIAASAYKRVQVRIGVLHKAVIYDKKWVESEAPAEPEKTLAIEV